MGGNICTLKFLTLAFTYCLSKKYYYLLSMYVLSYILMVPIDSEDLQGVVYVWVGSKADHDDATLTEEVAYMMYKVRIKMFM